MLDRSWYNTLVNDAGDNTSGSLWEKEDVDALMDAVDAELARLDAADAALSAADLHTNGVFERGRVLPLGIWEEVPFNPAHFTAEGGGAWTVNVASVVANRCSMIGGTLFWRLYVAWFVGSSVLSGTVTEVALTLPKGLGAPIFQGFAIPVAFNGAAGVALIAETTGFTLRVRRADGAPLTVGPFGFIANFPIEVGV